MDDKNIKTDNAILALLLEQQEIEQVKQEVGLVPGEDGYETHAGKFYTSADVITLRDNADFGLGSTNFAGLVAKKYDGIHDGQLVFDADGYARVGDKGSLQMIATREDAPLSNGIAFYDNDTRKFKTKGESTLSVAEAVNAHKLGDVGASSYLRNDLNDSKLSVSGGLTFTLEADSDNSNESDNVSFILSQDGGGTTATFGLNNSNDLYLNHGSKQVFKYDEGEEDVLFDSTVHSSAKFNKTVLFSPTSSNDIMNIRRYGNDHTVLNVWSPPQTSWGGAKESTLSLVRGDGNEYFLDIYNKDYGSSDQGNHLDFGEPEMGIRLQKRGSGTYTPFYIEYGNGSEEFKALEIHPNGIDGTNQSSVTLNRLIANYDGNRKFETTSEGTKTTGNQTATGTFISNTALGFKINSEAGYIAGYDSSGSVRNGFLQFKSTANSILNSDNGHFEIRGKGVKCLETIDSGSKTTGTHTISNTNGSGEFGSKNDSWFHFETDRPAFHFNKSAHATDRFAVYGTNTYLSNGMLKLNTNDFIKHTPGVNEGWEIVTDGIKDVEILRGVGIKNHRDVLNLGYVGSESFVGGFGGHGWRTDATGDATFDRLTVRKDFNVYELNVNKIRSGNGSYWFSDGMKFEKDYGTDSTDYRIGTESTSDNNLVPFKAGDILRCQNWTGRNVKYYTLIVAEVAADGSYFRALKSSKTGSGEPALGDELVRIGNTSDTNRQGAVYITSNDNDAPYIDVLDGVNSDSFGGKTKVRLGKLEGITSPTFGNLSGYGMWAQDSYLEGGINAKKGLIANCTINADSVSTTGWTLNSDGSGNLAKGAIAWDINGNTTLGSGVTLQWEHLSAASKANLKGEKGDQGIQGVAGQDGAVGTKGDQGVQGIQGLQGVAGQDGAKGDKGDTGTKGDTGAKGDKGDPGINGQDGRDGKDSPVLYFNAETRVFPTLTNYDGGSKYTFTSAWAGPATIWVRARDAEGAVHCGLNSADLGVMNGPNETILWYKFDCTLLAGSNEISIWSTTEDGGTIFELIVKAEPIKNTFIDATGLYTGTISANKINAGTLNADRIGANSISATKIKTHELVVGNNIAMGPNATISWSKVSGTSGVETTSGAQAKADAAKNSAISTAASDATAKANNAKSGAISTAASDATAKANNAKSDAISAAASDATTKANLAAKMSGSQILYRDPNFITGWNGTGTYNNAANGNVVRTLVTPSSDSPNKVGKMMKIVTSGSASPGHGGFYFSVGTHANRELICKFIAKIPVGYDVAWASNGIGTGATHKWLTPTAGTGRFEEYVYYVKAGYSGSFSSTHYYYLSGGAAPVTWYVAYATVFDSSVAEGYTTTIDANGIYTGTLTANQVKATGIKVGTNGIQLDSSATISWNNVTGTSSVETTSGSQAKANEAKNNAISTAASDATSKANIAKTQAISAATAKTENGTTIINQAGGGNFSINNSNQVGAIKICLPQSWTSTMLKVVVDVYNYSTGKSFTAELAGYNYGGGYWVNCTASIIGTINHTIRFGHDGSKCCIYIGETNTRWDYPKVSIRSVQAGYTQYDISKWQNGWNISLQTSLSSNIDHTVTNALIQKDAFDKAATALTNANKAQITANSKITSSQATQITKDTVTAAYVNAFALNASSITTGTLSASRISTGSLHGNKITSNTITATQIAANAITASELSANAVEAGHIKAGTITADKLDASVLTADNINFDNAVGNNVTLTGKVHATEGTIGGFKISGRTLYAGATGTNRYINIEAKSDGTGYIDIRGTNSSSNLLYIQGGRIQHQAGEFLAADVHVRGDLKLRVNKPTSPYYNDCVVKMGTFTSTTDGNQTVTVPGLSTVLFVFTSIVGSRIMGSATPSGNRFIFNRDDAQSGTPTVAYIAVGY